MYSRNGSVVYTRLIAGATVQVISISWSSTKIVLYIFSGLFRLSYTLWFNN